MRIFIQIEKDGLQEWCIMELQGTVSSNISDTLQAMKLGSLNFDERGNPILTVGYNVSTGKIKKLKKPLLITPKKGIETEDGKKELKVIAIIKYKLIFHKRPTIVLRNSKKK
eukprot:468749_1